MSYPSGPSGGYYASEQPSAHSDYSQWAAEPETGATVSHRSLSLAVALLGLCSYLVSFGPMLGVAGIDWDVRFPVLAGLLAGFGLLPRQAPAAKVVAALAGVGFLDALSRGIVVPDGVEPGWALWVVVVLNAAQTAVAVAAVRNQPAQADPQQAWYAAYAEQYAQAAAQYYGQYAQEDEGDVGYESGSGLAQQVQPVSATESRRASQSASYAEFVGDQAVAPAGETSAGPVAQPSGLPNVGHSPQPAQQQTVAFETGYRTSPQ